MNDFQYYTPTKVVFGRGTEEQAGQLVKEQGGTRALVHFGGRSARESGLLDRVLASLDRAGVAHVELGGVVPNPRLSKVREGMELCCREGVDFLLAVGGGSVIDSAKAIALVGQPQGDGLRGGRVGPVLRPACPELPPGGDCAHHRRRRQ